MKRSTASAAKTVFSTIEIPTISVGLDSSHKLYDNCRNIINDPDRRNRITEMKQENKFYFDAQWTEDERSDLNAMNQIDVTLNVCRRAIRHLVGQLVGPHPTANFIPADVIPSNQMEAQAYQTIQSTIDALQGLWNHCWFISSGARIMERAIRDMINMGLGWISVILDRQADYYRGELRFEARRPWEIIVPMNVSQPDFSDAAYMFYRTRVALTSAIDLLGKDYADVLRQHASPESGDIDWDVQMWAPDETQVYDRRHAKTGDQGDGSLSVDWLETEERILVPATLHKVRSTDGIINTVIHVSGETEDIDIHQYLKEREISCSKIVSTDIKVPRIRRTTQIGPKVRLSEEILPTERYSHVPFIDEDNETPLPYGEIFFIKAPQKLLNKSLSLAVLNMQTTGTGNKIVGLKGAFGDTPAAVEEFQKNFANPMSATELATEYRDGLNINNVISRMDAPPLNPATVQLISMMTNWADRILGINPLGWGDSTKAPRTLGATISIKEWGDETTRLPVIHIEGSLQRLGEVWLDRAFTHYRYPKLFTIKDINGRLQTHALNMPSDNGYIVNDLEDFKAKIFITSGSSMMLNRYSMLMMFRDLIPIDPIFLRMFILYSDLPEKFDILSSIDQNAQMTQMLNQVMPQLEQATKELDQVTQQNQDLNQKLALTKLKATLKGAETKYRERLKYMAQLAEMYGKVTGQLTPPQSGSSQQE